MPSRRNQCVGTSLLAAFCLQVDVDEARASSRASSRYCMLGSLEVKVRARQNIHHKLYWQGGPPAYKRKASPRTKTLSPTQEDACVPKQLTYSSHNPSLCSTKARSHYLGPSPLYPACATTLPSSLFSPPTSPSPLPP